jgi:hypothetical protein
MNGITMDWNIFGSAISGAIIGGIIAGYFALRATEKSFANQKIQSDDKEKKLIKSVLQAIHDEIETIYDRYQEAMGAHVESLGKNEALNMYYPLVSDFFTIYNTNSLLLGRIPNNDLRKQIIKTYTLAKGIVDSFRLNNDFVAKHEYAHKLYNETRLDVHNHQATAHYQALIDYAAVIKEMHCTLKIEVNILLRQLRKEGVLSENG